MDPLISVLVPVYNVEKYLPRCLDSVVTQTYANLEIILVDDGSTDGSGAICDAYAKEDCRVRVIHTVNRGVAAARNRLLAEAKGEYIMFVDSDDYVNTEAIRVLYDRLVLDGSEMAVGQTAFVYEDGRTENRESNWLRNNVISGQDVLGRMQAEERIEVGLWAKMYQKDVFLGIRCPMLTFGEDLWIFPALMERCKKISTVDWLVYYYYQRSNSIVHTVNESSTKDRLEAMLNTARYLLSHGFVDGATKWFEYSIGIAWPLRNRAEVAQQFTRYFDKAEEKQLAVNWNMKTRIQYASINSQFFYNVLQIGNRVAKTLKMKK